mmetsp:Transcript_20580/g.23857  ORF Transcript_20580/g.23857 Transcript_20580/m.23857 type:complete len:473 (-) Transcript_20580:131-1549(-)
MKLLQILVLVVNVYQIAVSARSHFEQEEPVDYGVDLSFPIHHGSVSTNYAWLPHNIDPETGTTPEQYKDMPIQYLGDRQKKYDEFIQGCLDFYPKNKRSCLQTEQDRVEMSKRQPASMQNYTDIGFKKIRVPDKLWSLLSDFCEKNKDKKSFEVWNKGNTYVNHWAAPTFMVSVENSSLRGGGSNLKQDIWDAARDTLEDWTGEELTQCSLYGIRVYTEGAVLAPHVDRLPLVSSAIVNIAQDVDEPWPIEVYGHDGRAYNVTMEPGDMVLYESRSLIHGRPFALKGKYFANVFIHFEPTGHSKRRNTKMNGYLDVDDKYTQSVKRHQGGHENDAPSGIPLYILPGSEEADRWRQRHPDNLRSAKRRSSETGSTTAHKAAKSGDVKHLKEIIEKMNEYVNEKDSNGWTPLHEGARGGHKDVVQLLLEQGANINEKTYTGETPLWWAEKIHGEEHSLVKLLRDLGALSLGSEL